MPKEDLLFINTKVQNESVENIIWINWFKAQDQLVKGFCIPLHDVSYMKYEV